MKKLLLSLALAGSLAVPQIAAPGRAAAFSTPDQGAPCRCVQFWVPGPNKWYWLCVCDV